MINKILLPRAKRDIVYETLEDEWSKKPYVFHSDNLRKDGKHWVHKDIEFNFLISGEATAYLDNQQIELEKGDIICVNPYVIHKFTTDTGAKIGILMINTGFLSKNAIDIEKLRFEELIKDEKAIELYNELISDFYNSEAFCETAIRGDILRFVAYICKKYSTELTKDQELSNLRSFGREFEYTSKAIDYINANFKKKLSLDEISAAAGASKYHFLRVFKSVTGYTAVEYINKIRCDYAKSLLTSGDYSVKQAALLSGFENLSHFTNTFKKYEGILPSALANKEKQ